MGIQLVDGRLFSEQDDARAPRVSIVNETMARRYWPGESPVGRRFEIWDDGVYEVVGVIRDVRHWGLDREVNPEMYFPMAQRPTSMATFVLSTTGNAAALTPGVREQLRAVDPDLPLTDVRTMEQVAARSVESQAATMRLLAIFGFLALVLAAAGIYGVMTHLVATRTGEISLRLTLGATPATVMRMILREGLVHAAAGLALGLAAGLLVMRAFRAALHGVSPADPLTVATAGMLLLGTALVACAVPARRAMRVEPAAALRQEL